VDQMQDPVKGLLLHAWGRGRIAVWGDDQLGLERWDQRSYVVVSAQVYGEEMLRCGWSVEGG